MFIHVLTDKNAPRTFCAREIRRPHLPIPGSRVGPPWGRDEKPGSNAGMQFPSVNNP